MNRFLLSCQCSRRIEVAAAQAGGVVRCPGCGASQDVPRLGELVALERVAGDPPRVAGASWNAGRAWLLAGAVIAVAAASGAVGLRGWRWGVAPLNDEAIRAAVAAADVGQVHASWLAFERQGIDRPPVMEEERRQRQARALAALERIAWGIAAAGGLAAAVAAVVVAFDRRGQAR